MAKFKQFLMNDHFRMFFTFTVIPALVAYNFFTAYARYSLNYLALGQSSIVSWISIYTLLAFIQLISYFSLCFGRKRGHIWLIVSLVLYFIFKILNINDLVAAGNASYIMSSSIYKLLCNDQSQVVFQRYLERASNSIFRALATLLFAHQDESLRRSMVSALSPTV